MGLSFDIAQRVQAVDFAGLPADAIHWAKVGLLDYLGVTLAGSREDAARLLPAALGLPPTGDTGAAVVFGHGRRVGALDAATINGTASHALDFDDISNTMGGHPSAPVLSALLALSDEIGACGKDFLAAYAAGFEVETKLARAVNFHHYRKGWHPTVTLGVFGVAAACAHLMRLPTDRIATALSLAASMASGLKSNFGTMTKPFHVGQCARNGLLAARLASVGYTASATALEHEQGFLEVFNGAGTYDMHRMFEIWAAPFDIVRPGIAIKRYPCCGSTHPALDAVIGLVRTHGLQAQDIEHIDVWLHPRRLAHTNRPDPRSDLDAKFSVQYCVARAVTDGRVNLQHFEDGAFRSEPAASLLRRVRAHEYGSDRFPVDNHFGAEVHVLTRSGAKLEAKVDEALGRTSDNPLPAAVLKEKFEDCSALVLAPAAVAQLHGLAVACETVDDMRRCTRLMLG